MRRYGGLPAPRLARVAGHARGGRRGHRLLRDAARCGVRIGRRRCARRRCAIRELVEQCVDRLRPAGVRASVALSPMHEQQGQMDRLVATMPIVRREVAPMGADTLPDAGGLFGVTGFDGSTYR